MIQISKLKPVLVTGATGYVAGVLVKRLLSEGITVHATVRDANNLDKLKYLKEQEQKFPGEIKFFEADLLKTGSFEEAMQGCELVYHTASPFILEVKDPQKDLVDPALKGTRNVLESVNKVSSVKKVVLTSSVAAIYGDNADMRNTKNGFFTEEYWNESSSLNHQPYSFSKTLAEKEAWHIVDQQDRWQLVVINPVLVIGPGLSPYATSESYTMFRRLIKGDFKSGVPDYKIGMVDVRDVAEAHFLAGYNSDSEGRYIVSAETSGMFEIAQILKEKYGDSYPFPKKLLPKGLVWLFAPMAGFKRKMIAKNIGYPFFADNTKSVSKLGVSYRPLRESIYDFFEQLKY